MSEFPMHQNSKDCHWGLYCITDAYLSQRNHLEVTKGFIEGGAKVVQFRDKVASFEELLDVGKELRALTREAGVTLLVNDNPYLCLEIEADGVHLGQSDFPPYIARDVLGPNAIIGLSTHSRQQALDAMRLDVDYIGVGPIYPTKTKSDAEPAVGTVLLRWISQLVPLPLVAIGGISRQTVPDVVSAGAHNVAMISDLVKSEDIAAATREVISQVQFYRTEDDV